MTRARDAKTGRFVKLAETQALTASAELITTADLERMPRQAEQWQERAWRLWRILGVLHYPTTFKAKQVGRLGWNVEVNGEQVEPEQAEQMMKAVTSPLGPREATKRLALLFEVAGDAYYARLKDEWIVYASTTPRRKEKLRAADIIVYGMQSDPEDPDKVDSSVRSALDTAESIRLKCALSRSQDRNRLSQRGILLIPKEAQFPDDDPFGPKLEASIKAPIADEYAAAAVVPLKVDVPGSTIEQWRHLVLESPYDEKLMDRIDAEIKHLALELDIPAEMLLGFADVNHWTAWLSDESNYRAHVEPLGFLVGQILAKAMMAAIDGAVEIVVTPDPSELLARRSSVADAFEAYRLGVVGSMYLRKQIGADEDDVATAEDIALLLAVTGNANQAAPQLPAQGTGQTDVGPPALPSTTPNGNGKAPVVAAIDDTRAEALDELSRQLVAIDVGLLGTLKGAAAIAVEHARSKVASEDVGAPARVADAMAGLGRVWKREVSEARASLTKLGIDARGPVWDQAAEASLHMLIDGMTAHVTESLDKSDAEMPALPVLLLRQVIATAGGSSTATVAALPSPTFADPQGFAVGVLSLRDMKKSGVQLVNWRFRYGPLHRDVPFLPHKEQDGRFANTDGEVHGWFPGDHKGCECFLDPVLRIVKTPTEV